jgi:hypothetical protein
MNQTNNDFFPWDDVPDSNVFPTLTGLFEWTKLEDGESSSGKRMLRSVFTCIQPTEYAGMCHFENYVLGNDENPKGIVQGAMGTKAVKQAATAAQLRIDSVANACTLISAQKPQLMLSLSYSRQEGGEYAGREQNRVTAYHKIGERPVQIAPKPGSQVKMQAPQAPLPSAPAPSQGVAQGPPVQQNVAPPMPQQVQAPQVQAPQMQAPAPPVQQAPVQPPMQAAPTPAVLGIPCNICGQVVPAADFANHVQMHANGQ